MEPGGREVHERLEHEMQHFAKRGVVGLLANQPLPDFRDSWLDIALPRQVLLFGGVFLPVEDPHRRRSTAHRFPL